jgi:LuxR family transcriptional regulator, maltose regulon positive regulatory protein
LDATSGDLVADQVAMVCGPPYLGKTAASRATTGTTIESAAAPPEARVRNPSDTPDSSAREEGAVFGVTDGLPPGGPGSTVNASTRSVLAASGGAEDPGLRLVRTKLVAPAPRGLVARGELIEALAGGLSRPVTVILGPAGSGKTTLLAQWRWSAGERQAVAWLSLDTSDNEPLRFWTYVIVALRSVLPAVGETALRLLRAPGVELLEEALPALLNDLLDSTQETVLVLDDYHALHEGLVHRAMAFFLEQLPEGVRVVIASRSQPPFPLARLRARGALSEIEPGQLSFSESDTGVLLNDVHGLSLSDGAVRQLNERTEGWAAGLYLAALSLGRCPDRDQLIASFAGSDRRIVDYLGTEVLDRQPDDVLAFLLRTSVLERLCAPLCDAVTGNAGGQELLERIERSNAFLVPLDEHRDWYRYHHLFAELLRHELGRREPGSVALRHRLAADWLMGAGLVPEAVRHMVAAGDVDGVAGVVVSHRAAFVNAGQRGTVGEWLDAIPDERLRRDGRLCVVRAWFASVIGRREEILPWLDRAERAPIQNPAEDRRVWLEATALRGAAYERMGDMGQARRFATQIGRRDGSSPWHGSAAYLLGVSASWFGDDAAAVERLKEAVDLGYRTENPVVSLLARGRLAAIAADHGGWDECRASVEAAFGLIEERDQDEYWFGALAHVANGRLLRRARKLREADAELARAVALGRRGVGVVDLAYTLVMLADLRRELGDRRSARELVIEARGLLDRAPDPGPVVPGLVEQAERSLRLVTQRQGTGVAVGEELTAREQAVLYLLPGGLSAREIGDELGVSRNTIKTHTKSLYRKLGATSRREAVARGRQLGLL